jgi:septum site-determining protein MinC
MSQAQTIQENAGFLLKGSNFTLTTLQLLNVDYPTIQKQLADKVEQAPAFFNHTPIVLDLSKISMLPVDIDFTKILNMIRQNNLIPVGVRGGTTAQREHALTLGLAVLPEAKTTATEAPAPQPVAAPAPKLVHYPKSPSLLITQPVRSGQQIYARDADLIITSSVSAGAEVLADGHIHIYGILRGRALAGVNGDKDARIFCRNLEAELVSVAGQYCVTDDFRQTSWGKDVYIALHGEHLQITPLS